jgi:hypothetical protein
MQKVVGSNAIIRLEKPRASGVFCLLNRRCVSQTRRPRQERDVASLRAKGAVIIGAVELFAGSQGAVRLNVLPSSVAGWSRLWPTHSAWSATTPRPSEDE